jgi:hypothetical protein
MAIKKEIVSSAAVILFGVVFLVYNRQYPFDTLANPGPGVFPLIVGAVLVGLGAWQIVEDRMRPNPARDCEEKGLGSISIRSLKGCLQKDNAERSVLLMVGTLVLYLLMVKWVGFFFSNFLFVIVAARLMGAMDLVKPLVLSAGVNVFCYVLFEVWLKLSFPRGILF